MAVMRTLRRYTNGWIAAAVTAAAWWLYGATMAPGLQFGDAGEFQFALPSAGVVHPPGYPLYGMLGWLWSRVAVWWPEPATRINGFSVLWAGLAAGLFFLVSQVLLGRVLASLPGGMRRLSGLVATLVVMVSPTLWSQATIAEVYALNAFLVLAVLYALLRWAEEQRTVLALGRQGAEREQESSAAMRRAGRWLMAAALAFGLGLTHHTSMILMAPAAALFVLRVYPGIVRRPRQLLVPMLVALLPLVLYAFVPWRAGHTPYLTMTLATDKTVPLYQADLSGFVRWVTGARFASALRPTAEAALQLPQALDWTVQQFGAAGFLFIMTGLVYLILRQRYGVLTLTGAAFLAYLAFNLFYGIGDIAVLYIPVYLVFGLWLAVGLGATASGILRTRLLSNYTRRQQLAWLVLLGLLAWPLLVGFVTYPQQDRSQDNSARVWWDHLLSQLAAEDAILVSNDRDEMTPLYYYQYVLGQHPQLTAVFPQIVEDPAFGDLGRTIDTLLAATRRPIYLVKPMPGLDVKYNLAAHGGLTLVVGPAVTRPPERPTNKLLGSVLRLNGYDVNPTDNLVSGAPLSITLYWQPQQRVDGNYTSFLQLLDSQGNKFAQAEDHVAGGAYYPTSLWRPGEFVRDVFTMTVPADLVPGPYTLLAGMYRLNDTNGDIQPLAPPIEVGKVGRLPAAATALASPARTVNAELQDRVLLVGYTLGDVGATLPVVLYWKTQGWLDRDYTVFLHLVDQNGQIVAQSDSQPATGLAPTSIWGPGALVYDAHNLTLPANLPPGRYQLLAGMYDAETGQRLPVTESVQPGPNNAVLLDEVVVGAGTP